MVNMYIPIVKAYCHPTHASIHCRVLHVKDFGISTLLTLWLTTPFQNSARGSNLAHVQNRQYTLANHIERNYTRATYLAECVAIYLPTCLGSGKQGTAIAHIRHICVSWMKILFIMTQWKTWRMMGYTMQVIDVPMTRAFGSERQRRKCSIDIRITRF